MDLEKGVAPTNEVPVGTLPKVYIPAGYEPKYRVASDGTLICHDPLLSISPAALIDFLTRQASTPPVPTISVRGWHNETRTETYTETIDNVTTTRTREVVVEVEDFSFRYTLNIEIKAGLGYAPEGGEARAIMYQLGDWDVAYRGGPTKEKGGKELGAEVEVTRAERKKLEADLKQRKRRGMPLFVNPLSLHSVESDAILSEFALEAPPGRLLGGHFVDFVEDHSFAPFSLAPYWSRYQPLLDARNERRREIEQVARDYVPSAKSMKELNVRKETYGWDWEKVEQRITSVVRQTGYSSLVSVAECTLTERNIVIRPDTTFGKIFSSRWYWKALLWIVLVYPVLLIVEKCLGARYTALRVAFPLCRWRALPFFGAPPSNAEEAAALAAPLGGGYRSPKVAQLPSDGTWVYMVGFEEEEWVASNSERIRNIVVGRQRGVDLSWAGAPIQFE